jgi:phosphatidylserine/phosphatidylglycerophosphate/cardiolipin synthase-like enzyme
VNAIVAAQYAGLTLPTPTLEKFGKGEATIFVACHDVIGHVASSRSVEVRAFDDGGLLIDPAFVFAQFARLAAEGFGRLARPDGPTVAGWATAWASAIAPRQTLVFCDYRGKPYEPWEDVDPPPHPPEPPVPAPERTFLIPDKSITQAIPNHGVVVFANGSAEHTALRDHVVDLTIAGEHTRLGLYPHGIVGESLSAGFPAWSFFRVQVIDYARWFPRNANDRNQMQRYSEGNHLQFLVDGRSTYREMYRDIRSTYMEEEYLREDDMPAGTPRSPLDIAGTQVLVLNAWISARNTILGRRAMIRTPRMQRGPRPPANLPDQWIAKPMFGFTDGPSSVPPLSKDDLQRLYCLVIAPGILEPGTFLDLRQLAFSSKFSADDPRIVGEDAGADMYGRIAPKTEASSWTFAGPTGSCVLRAVFDPDWEGEAQLRVMTWEPDKKDPGPLDTATSGRGKLRVWPYGTIELPAAPGGLTPSGPSGVNVAVPAQLLWDGTIGEVTIFLPAGLVTSAPVTAVVVNQRTGEAVSVAIPSTGLPTEIRLENFAREDGALLGFTTEVVPTITGCEGFFELQSSESQQTDGLVPQHSKETGGLLREAIQAGVDVRLLAWNDQFTTENLLRDSPGMIALLNPEIDGRRGQAMLDRVGRETGVHHQKSIFVRTPIGAVAFVGGIDLRVGRFDDPPHPDLNPDRPGGFWHDIHCRIVGRAVWDVYRNFQDRWNISRAHPEIHPVPAHATAVPAPSETEILSSPRDGFHAVQITRTIPPHVDQYDSIVDRDRGDRSCFQSYARMIALARRFLYVEEQYLWNPTLAHKIRDRLVAPDGIKWAIIVLPRQLSEFPVLDLVFYAMRRRNINLILTGDEALAPGEDPAVHPAYIGDRVLFIHPIETNGKPVYVHAKTVIADDIWMSIGSSNMSRRSMNLDSEINAASIDVRTRRGAQLTARELRVALMAEHLNLLPEERPLVEDPDEAFRLFKSAAAGERRWTRNGFVQYDPVHTQYGHQPPEFDPYFPDALAAGMDPDGDSLLEFRLVDFLSMRQTFQEASDPADFGDVTAIRAAANVGTFPPLDPGVDSYLWTAVLSDPSASPAIAPRSIGPIAATEEARFGIVPGGITWRILGQVVRRTAPTVVISNRQVDVTSTGLVTSVTLDFPAP